MNENVVRFSDYERKADITPRGESAVVIILPVIRIERPVVEAPPKTKRKPR